MTITQMVMYECFDNSYNSSFAIDSKFDFVIFFERMFCTKQSLHTHLQRHGLAPSLNFQLNLMVHLLRERPQKSVHS